MTLPASLPPFATADQYELYTGKPAPPGTQEQLDAVSASIRRYCGWHIAPDLDMVLTVDGPGGPLLILPTLHMTSVAEVTEQIGDWPAAVYDPATDLQWSVNGQIRKGRYGSGCYTGRLWTTHLSGVTATVNHGWPLADVSDLTQLVLSTVARASVNPYGLTSQAVGGVSIGLSTGPGGSAGGLLLYPDQQEALDGYRLERRP